MVEGQCNCGAVKFRIDDRPTDIFICHCSICRRSTGSNGIAVVVVNNDKFQWRGDDDNIRTWNKPNADWHTAFCRTCGSPLPGANDESTMYVPAGLLNGVDETLRVAHHIWVDSKADWDEIGDSGQQHREAFKTG